MFDIDLQLFAQKKGMGSSRNGRDSKPKMLGGQWVTSGSIIVRQRGTRIHPGLNVGVGRDHTIFAKADGIVSFTRKGKTGKVVSILTEEVPATAPQAIAGDSD